jgi:hypothetical protein
MVYSDELIGTTEYLTLEARCRINRCRYDRVPLYSGCMSRFCKAVSTSFMSCEHNIQNIREVPTPLLVFLGTASNRKVMHTNSDTIPIHAVSCGW